MVVAVIGLVGTFKAKMQELAERDAKAARSSRYRRSTRHSKPA
jgi:hypothetical protein